MSDRKDNNVSRDILSGAFEIFNEYIESLSEEELNEIINHPKERDPSSDYPDDTEESDK